MAVAEVTKLCARNQVPPILGQRIYLTFLVHYYVFSHLHSQQKDVSFLGTVTLLGLDGILREKKEVTFFLRGLSFYHMTKDLLHVVTKFHGSIGKFQIS